jgi:hypothetical protein
VISSNLSGTRIRRENLDPSGGQENAFPLLTTPANIHHGSSITREKKRIMPILSARIFFLCEQGINPLSKMIVFSSCPGIEKKVGILFFYTFSTGGSYGFQNAT